MHYQYTYTKTNNDLDVGVSVRQAFGSSFAKPSNLEERLEAYWSGQLILPPQPIWEGDVTNWTADPFGDNNWRFQHHSLRWLNPLRWAALAGDKKAADEWIRVVKSWAASNIPAENSKSDFAWRDMVDGNRAIQLSLGSPLVGANNEWFTDLLEYHRAWLMNKSNIVGKNHGLHQHMGLLVVGAVLHDHPAIQTAVRRMSDQFESTFDKQGTNDEGSTVYHQHNIIWWSQAWRRATAEGIDPPNYVQRRLEAARNVLAHLALPNGELPQIGDGGRVKLQKGLGDEVDFVASGGIKGVPPTENALVFDRGYIVSRSGWGSLRPLADESHMLIRYGDELRAHSHYDRGSIHIYANGRRWLVDSGFYSYRVAEPINRYLKSREAHNLATIVNREHKTTAPVELIRSSISDEIHDFTLVDYGYKDASLYRRVLYLVGPDCWIVADRADTGQAVQICQNWHVEPGASLRVRDNGFRLDAGSHNFNMYWLGRNVDLSVKRAGEGSHDAWIGTKWKTLEPSIKVTAKSRNNQPHIVTLLAPSSSVPLSIVESRLSIDDNLFLYVARGNLRWELTIYDGKASLKRVGVES